MSAPNYKEEWKTTANLITIIRIICIPVFIVVLLAPWPQWFFTDAQELQYWTLSVKPWVAAVVYAVLALTDGIDGYIARSRNQVTALGKFLDPIADKILVSSALIALVELGDLPSWVVIVIISREFIVSGLRMIAATEGVVVAARMSGKVKTALTLVAILLFIIKRSEIVMSLPSNTYTAIYVFSWMVMVVALIATLWSMFVYFKQVFSIMDQSQFDDETAEVAGDELAKNSCTNEYNQLAAQVLDAARNASVHVATAESCTGGMVGEWLTAVPGSSDVFEGGVISYAYDVKSAQLGVSTEDLQRVGAVSQEVALQMAQGARERLLGQFDDQHAVAVAITGVAGPGCSENKPAGTVWFGVAGRGQTKAFLRNFEGDRNAVRQQSAMFALELLAQRLK